ncbi:MAG: hypothetical protein QM698_09830 [Micropepsaceae bacterium]
MVKAEDSRIMMRSAKIAAIASSIAMVAMSSVIANVPIRYFPDRLSGSVSPKPGIPALSFDMSLDTNGRFQKIVLTFEGRSFDLLDVPGAERLRVLENVELENVFFGFEGPMDWPDTGKEGPWLTFFYRPILDQPQFCEAGTLLHVYITVGDSAGVGPIYFNCEVRNK